MVSNNRLISIPILRDDVLICTMQIENDYEPMYASKLTKQFTVRSRVSGLI